MHLMDRCQQWLAESVVCYRVQASISALDGAARSSKVPLGLVILKKKPNW